MCTQALPDEGKCARLLIDGDAQAKGGHALGVQREGERVCVAGGGGIGAESNRS